MKCNAFKLFILLALSHYKNATETFKCEQHKLLCNLPARRASALDKYKNSTHLIIISRKCILCVAAVYSIT